MRLKLTAPRIVLSLTLALSFVLLAVVHPPRSKKRIASFVSRCCKSTTSTSLRPSISALVADWHACLTMKKEIEKESPNTLFLLAGDTISPSVESITYKGAQMIDAWNTAGLDYSTFGNHEFDFGPDVLRERMKESKFKWIAANVIDKKTGKPFGERTAVCDSRI